MEGERDRHKPGILKSLRNPLHYRELVGFAAVQEHAEVNELQLAGLLQHCFMDRQMEIYRDEESIFCNSCGYCFGGDCHCRYALVLYSYEGSRGWEKMKLESGL